MSGPIPIPDNYDEIESAIEDELERLANSDAAAAWSTIDDQTMMDLEEDGYDDRSAIMTADFGYQTVVNGDVLVPPHFVKELKLKRSKHPKLWREHENSKGENAAYLLGGWLVKNGYKKLSKYGGDVFSQEQEIGLGTVVDAVMSENKGFRLADVGLVVENMFGGADYAYWGSSDGDTELWAKPLREENRTIAPGRKRNPRKHFIDRGGTGSWEVWYEATKPNDFHRLRYQTKLRAVEAAEMESDIWGGYAWVVSAGKEHAVAHKGKLIAPEKQNKAALRRLRSIAYLEPTTGTLSRGRTIASRGKRAPSRKRNPGKAQARNRCIALMRKIQKLEREGKSGYPDWHETKSKLDVALRDYRSSGASPAEMFSLGPEEQTITPRGKRNPNGYRITGRGLDKTKKIRMQKNTVYFMGASTSPDMVIVTGVTDDTITFRRYPFAKDERIQRWIGEDLMAQGSSTWLKSGYAKHHPEQAKSLRALLDGKPGKTVKLSDYKEKAKESNPATTPRGKRARKPNTCAQLKRNLTRIW